MMEQARRPLEADGTQTAQANGQTTQEHRQERLSDARPATVANQGSRARRGGRLSLAVSIRIIGSDAEGKVFSEETHTVVLSQHGAGIVSRQKLGAEQELVLRAVEAKREAVARVVGEIAKQGEVHTYGVAFVDAELDFWRMEFPETADWDSRPALLLLECGGCKGTVELENGDFEYDICRIHGGLARFCEDCGFLTVWSQSHELAPARPKKVAQNVEEKAALAVALPLEDKRELREASAVAKEMVALADSTEGTERRVRVRAKVNFFACVRSAEFGDEVVRCIDMSRGGVSFRSKHVYAKEKSVLIAVPFSPEEMNAPAIYVKGRIAHVKEVAGLWRCGVEFVR
ncbi:MAG: PilZ domain-containing protein [Candidatus Acidiferrum sp.]